MTIWKKTDYFDEELPPKVVAYVDANSKENFTIFNRVTNIEGINNLFT